ncbi:helix-turn-helix transcriptional regulator [Haloarcula salina]|uniref:helix-turn-helix transcriptional regulator n=1 Tax=Haloarcula salina TaxID=1429914 RepID=UPI003C6F88CB
MRTDIVGALCPADRTTADLLADLDASESAVYDALANLERRGLLRSADGTWRLTGTGRLVADTIHRQRLIEQLIEGDAEYWERHDASVIPQPFRHRLCELGSYEVVRGTQTDIDRPVREVVTRVESVENCQVVSPVYHREYEAAMPDTPGSRLVVGCDVIDGMIDAGIDDGDRRTFDETAVRVTPVDYALGVSTEWVILTLPQMDGEWPSAKLVSETDEAVAWGSDLFESLWTDATPLGTYLADH